MIELEAHNRAKLGLRTANQTFKAVPLEASASRSDEA